ncbi:hypothetical protein Tco_0067646 [Tanacetum coccineum]
MGGIGGGSFAKRSMVAKDGLGGDGFVVDGGRSPRTSSKDGEDGGVENKSSMGSRLIITVEIVVEWLLEKLVGLPMCSPMVERMVDREEKRLVLFFLGIVKIGIVKKDYGKAENMSAGSAGSAVAILKRAPA